MKTIILTGGIASGKTTAAKELEKLGASIIDADIAAREVVEKGTEGLKKIVDVFGEDYLREDGTLDRAKLRDLISFDKASRETLNALTHPLIYKNIFEKLEELKSKDIKAVVVAIPLYFDTGIKIDADEVWNIESTNALRIKRIVGRDNINVAAAAAMLKAQIGNRTRRALSDVTIKNNDDIESFKVRIRKQFLL